MPLYNIVITKESAEPTVTGGCCPFDFGSVMGQEDLYREDPPGTRVNNTLTARIVWGTTVPATSRVIWDLADAVGFGNDTGVVASDVTFHEVFFDVPQVGTLYKFQIITTSDECEVGETLQSGTFYFEVGNDVILGESSITHVVDVSTFPPNGFSLNIEIVLSGEYVDSTVEGNLDSSYELTLSFNTVLLDYSEQINLGSSELYTNFSTNVT